MATGGFWKNQGRRMALFLDLFVPGAQDKVEAAMNIYSTLTAKKSAPKTFTLVFPCNFKHALLGPNRVAGVELEIHNWKTIKTRLPAKEMLDNLQLQFLLHPKECSFAVIEQEAHDVQEALDTAHNKMELVRSVINYYKSHPVHGSEDAKRDSLSQIHPPRCAYIFNNSHEMETVAPLMGDFSHDTVIFSEQEDQELRALVSHIDTIKQYDLKKMICKAFLVHNQALDEPKTDEAFTLYWKSLDLVTINKNLPRDEYLRRVSCLFAGDTNPVLELYARRERPQEVTTHDVNCIKALSEDTIGFLLDNTQHINSPEGLMHLFEKEQGHA